MKMLAITGSILLGTCASALAQNPTLPEMAQERPGTGPINAIVTGDFPAITLDQLLKTADLVVHGTVAARSAGYLSQDQHDILTDYTLAVARVIAPDEAALVPTPGMHFGPIVVTYLGGSMRLAGHDVTIQHTNLKPFTVGLDAILILNRMGEKYRIAGDALGAFGVEDGTIVPLGNRGSFGHEYRGWSVEQFIAEIQRGFDAKLRKR